jgi:branched-chain amino acid transport system substrate-binding protein
MQTQWLRGLLAYLLLIGPALAAEAPLKLGVLTDMSSVFSEAVGKGSVAAVELAVEDAGGQAFGQPITVVSADFQMKADIALSIAREWFDRRGVDAIFDVIGSGNALAVNSLAKEAKKLVFITAAAADAVGGEQCNGYGINWLYDLTSLYRTLIAAQLEKGNKTWFMLLPDGAFGTSAEALVRNYLPEGGGKIVGAVRFPYETQDFSSILLQAQSSGAQLIVSTAGGAPNVTIMKQGREFGLPNDRQKLTATQDIITDIKAIGQDLLEGQIYGSSFYWNYDERSRAFGRRFYNKIGQMPTNLQAAGYSAALWYIKAVNATNSRDPQVIRAWLQSQIIDDATTRNAHLRKGGRLVREMYAVRVKNASKSTEPWDYYDVAKVIRGEDAFGKDTDSACPMDK